MTVSTATVSLLKEKRARVQDLGYPYERLAKHDVNRCPICLCDGRSLLVGTDRYGFPANAYECADCGATYLSPRLTDAQYADFYEHWYRPILTAYYGHDMDAESIQESQGNYSKVVVPKLAPALEKHRGGSLLDVGGSTGVLAYVMRELYELIPTVVDPSGPEIAEAQKRDIATVHGTLNDVPLNTRWDVITLFQTIEHLTDPIGTLRRAAALLKPGGTLIFDSVPLDQQRALLHSEMLIKIDHPLYLTHYSSLRLIERAGLGLDWFDQFTNRHHHYITRKRTS